MAHQYTVPGLDTGTAERVCALLQNRLTATIDLQLTLKHVHWNVVGPNFIGVHEMLDEHVAEVREMSDELAERIATLGGQPMGTPQFVVDDRTWSDYSLGRDTVERHLAALDMAYTGVLGDHRSAIAELEELDPVTQDILIEQTAKLEMYQWFVRAHLEDPAGSLVHGGAAGERQAANQVSEAGAR